MTEETWKGLEPELLWKHFHAISRIPRCSRDEERVRAHVHEIIGRNGHALRTDRAGNTVVRLPARSGREAAPVIVLQAHLDMVCEKNRDTAHDFARDPVRWRREGGWMKARGTTLGADNGIGVAAQLAVLEDPAVAHGPLELLFTVDEETGLTGAMGLEGDMLEGRRLLNMDSEEEGALYIGCTGGQDTDLLLPVETEPAPRGHRPVRLRLGGLQGGHSGLEIHKGHGNAIRLLARFLGKQGTLLQARIAGLDGGSKRNAIPRECDALLYLPQDRLPALGNSIRTFEEICRQEYARRDPGVYLHLEENAPHAPDRVLVPNLQDRLLQLLLALPHGVTAMSADMAGLVETSTNLAMVQTGEREVRVATNQRSAVATALVEISDRVAAAGSLAGARIRRGQGYPSWTPNPDSPLLGLARERYAACFGVEPTVQAIHAGLECGIIGDRFPGMDMISFGPTIEGAHSPDERVDIASVRRFWQLLVSILEA